MNQVTKRKSELTEADARWEWWELEHGSGVAVDNPLYIRGARVKDVPAPPPGFYYRVVYTVEGVKRKLVLVPKGE